MPEYDEGYDDGYQDAWADLEMWYDIYDEGWDWYVADNGDEYA